MSVMCAWASLGSNGKIKGDVAGDQNGREVKCGGIYNFGQTRVYRCKDRSKALLIGAAAKAVALNDNVGYDQSQRTSVYNILAQNNWVVSAINTPCEVDCSELGAVAVNVAYGKALICSAVYSGNIGAALKATGLFVEYAAPKYMGKSEYIECGDIIVKPGSHVIIAYTDGSKATVSNTAPVATGNAIIRKGQKYAIEFTGVKIDEDGIVGNETRKMKSRVLQHAMNLDYKKGQIIEDGAFGNASKAKLGTHYVEQGEQQWMVTAAEILMYLNGIDAGGVEYPGKYGNGLKNAAIKKFGGNGTRITANNFLALLN